jgi:hypothetical protein
LRLSRAVAVSVLLPFLSATPVCRLARPQVSRFSVAYVTGSWTDACPCKVPCSCWKGHVSSARTCVNFHVFRIRNGVFYGVDLSGSVFVLANLPRAPWQEPVPDTLFVTTHDDRTTCALQASLHRLFGFTPRKVLHTAIEYHESRNQLTVRIPSLLLYKVSFKRKQTLSPDVSENLYAWLSNPRQGTAEIVKYSPKSGEKVRYSHTNAISGDFDIPIPSPETDGRCGPSPP